jgi:CBS domain-containing protein
MKAGDIMTVSVESIDATESIACAAGPMAAKDLGALPVTDGDKVVGIVTDRDIAVRAVAHAVNSGSPVRRVMTAGVRTCAEDDDVEEVLEIMSDEQVRRVPVCGEDGGLVGIVALADAARYDRDRREVAETLAGICAPSGPHCQSIAAE